MKNRGNKRVKRYVEICDNYHLGCNTITWKYLDKLSNDELFNEKIVKEFINHIE